MARPNDQLVGFIGGLRLLKGQHFWLIVRIRRFLAVVLALITWALTAQKSQRMIKLIKWAPFYVMWIWMPSLWWVGMIHTNAAYGAGNQG